jgi:hypothetical protein
MRRLLSLTERRPRESEKLQRPRQRADPQLV